MVDYHQNVLSSIRLTASSTAFLVMITGVVGTTKAVVSEISDDNTQALGVSIISTSWGLGFIIGPAVSGAISDPIGQYDLIVTSKTTQYIEHVHICFCIDLYSVPV